MMDRREGAPRMILPGPAFISGQPAMPPAPGSVGNTGKVHGTQSRRDWAAGETDARMVCDALKADCLWRFSAFGAVYITILYGTLATRQIFRLQAPVVMTIPGQFLATAQPINPEHTGVSCDITLTPATASEGTEHARAFVTAGGGAVALELGAVRFVALTASTLTISGAAVAVPALSAVPLVAGSTLNTGSGFQEFEA
jgi:hypothetical protein